MQTLIALISAVLSALLRAWLQQRGHTMEIEQRVRLEGALSAYEAANRALAYKDRAATDGVRDDLRVQQPDAEIIVPSHDPSVVGEATPAAMPSEAPPAGSGSHVRDGLG